MDQYQLAKENMIKWLAFPEELGKVPDVIECTKRFVYDDYFYYIFKFKKNISDEKWMLGVCGGYEENSEENTGHTFSDRNEYIKETEEQDAIHIIEEIKHYWKAKAQQILEKEINEVKE